MIQRTLLCVAALMACGPLYAQDFGALRDSYERVKDEPFSKRAAALTNLGKSQTKEAAAYLGRLYQVEKEDNGRRMILRCLGRVGVAPAPSILAKVALNSTVKSDRQVAVASLGQCKPTPPMSIWKGLLEARSASVGVREGAAKSLSRYPPSQDLLRAYAGVLGQEPPPPGQVVTLCREALETILRRDMSLGTWLLGEGLQDEGIEPALPALTEILLSSKSEASKKALPKLLRHDSPKVRAAAARACGKVYQGAGNLDECPQVKELLEDKTEGVRAAALSAIQQIGAQSQALDKLLELAESRNKDMQTVAFSAMIGAKDPAVVEAATKMLEKGKHMPAQAAAIQVLAQSQDKGAIDVLIKRLKKIKGRLKLDILIALARLTQASPGNDYKDWDNWWKEQRAGFTFPDQKRVVTGSAGDNPFERNMSSQVRKSKAPTYYGTEVLSHRIAFVCDISGSMRNPSRTDGKSRIDVLKQELSNVVKGLPSKTAFNIYTFESDWKSWQKNIVKANGKNKKDALDFIANSNATGQTMLFEPLEAALLDPEVDTIYLLSDGAPSRGRFTHGNDILREVARLNRTRRVAIHTIAIGKQSNLMIELARRNGGLTVQR